METTLIVVVAGAMCAGFVQGVSGFAFGMVAMSFWAWVLEPQVAAALAVCCSLAGQILAAFSVRRGAHWPQLLPFVLGGLAGIPVGLWLLPQLNMLWFKAGLGALLLIWCPTMLLMQRLPPLRMAGAWPMQWRAGRVVCWVVWVALRARFPRCGAACAAFPKTHSVR